MGCRHPRPGATLTVPAAAADRSTSRSGLLTPATGPAAASPLPTPRRRHDHRPDATRPGLRFHRGHDVGRPARRRHAAPRGDRPDHRPVGDGVRAGPRASGRLVGGSDDGRRDRVAATAVRRFLRHPLVWGSLSIALLALVAWRSKAWELGDQLGDADPRPIAAAVLLNLVIVVAWAARSSNLLAGAGRPVPILPLIPMTAFANTINNITPGSAGELVRLYLLRAQYGVDYTTGAAVVLIERVVAIVRARRQRCEPLADLHTPAPCCHLRRRYPGRRDRTQPRLQSGDPPDRDDRLAAARTVGRPCPLGHGPEHPRPGRHVSGCSAGRPASRDRLRRVDRLGVHLLYRPAPPGRSRLSASRSNRRRPGVRSGSASSSVSSPCSHSDSGLPTWSLRACWWPRACREAVAITFGYRLVSTLPLGLLGVASYAFLSARLPHGHASEAARAASAALAGSTPQTDESTPG